MEKIENIPEYCRTQKAVWFYLEESLESLVKDLLMGLFKLQHDWILTLMDYPKRGCYDVTFTSKGKFVYFMDQLEGKKDHPKMVEVRVTPHFIENEKLFIVKMYSPYVQEEDIARFLKGYCKEVSGRGKVLNQFGFWTGKRKFLCKMKEKPGAFLLPPARFKVGKATGDLFFTGMGIFCKNCKLYGHGEDSCKKKCCTKCLQEGHLFLECPQGKRCRVCNQMGHMANNCPEKEGKVLTKVKDGSSEERPSKSGEPGKEIKGRVTEEEELEEELEEENRESQEESDLETVSKGEEEVEEEVEGKVEKDGGSRRVS